MVGGKVDGQILFGARSEKPKILFRARGEKQKNLFETTRQLRKFLFGSQRVIVIKFIPLTNNNINKNYGAINLVTKSKGMQH